MNQYTGGVLAGSPSFCGSCGLALTPQALICSSCRQLVHAADLEELARQAHMREVAGDSAGGLELWRKALALLPPESAQAASIRRKVGAYDTAVAARIEREAAARAPGPSPPEKKPQPEWIKRLGPLGVLGAALLKFKFLLSGLLQLKTLLSMLAFFGVYWSIYGWKFAAGFVIGIYIHEMGHVWMLRHYGMQASAPMFIPGL